MITLMSGIGLKKWVHPSKQKGGQGLLFRDRFVMQPRQVSLTLQRAHTGIQA